MNTISVRAHATPVAPHFGAAIQNAAMEPMDVATLIQSIECSRPSARNNGRN
jgi:hypothetical protein